METRVAYACSECGKKFDSSDSCERHERLHSTCRCKFANKAVHTNVVVGYGKRVVSGVDFDARRMFTFIPTGCDSGYTKYADISNCPWCGDELAERTYLCDMCSHLELYEATPGAFSCFKANRGTRDGKRVILDWQEPRDVCVHHEFGEPMTLKAGR